MKCVIKLYCSSLHLGGFPKCVLTHRSMLFVYKAMLLECRSRRAQKSIPGHYTYRVAVELYNLTTPSEDWYH